MLCLLVGILGLVSGRRVVAIGDLHGDYETALETLQMAKVVDGSGHWAGGSELTVVQTGDVLDRGKDTIKLFKWIIKLQNEAAIAGGSMVQLLGNHEIMNLKEDYRYVTKKEIKTFGGKEARAEAFSKTGWLGKYLRSRNMTHQIGNTVFVHGGINQRWASLKVSGINQESSGYLLHDSPGELKSRDIFSGQEDGPTWFRGYAKNPDCEELGLALEALGASRMIMGHSINDDHKIHTHCDGKAILIDVGLSRVYGKGHHAALELTQSTNQAIYPLNTVSLPHVTGIDDDLHITQRSLQYFFQMNLH